MVSWVSGVEGGVGSTERAQRILNQKTLPVGYDNNGVHSRIEWKSQDLYMSLVSSFITLNWENSMSLYPLLGSSRYTETL